MKALYSELLESIINACIKDPAAAVELKELLVSTVKNLMNVVSTNSKKRAEAIKALKKFKLSERVKSLLVEIVYNMLRAED